MKYLAGLIVFIVCSSLATGGQAAVGEGNVRNLGKDVLITGSLGERGSQIENRRLKGGAPRASCLRNRNPYRVLLKYRHALKRFEREKTRAILARRFRPVREGQTLSELIPDHRNYQLVLRKKAAPDQVLKRPQVQQDHYLWREGGRIVMSRDLLLMAPETERRHLLDIARTHPRIWTLGAYRREIEKTLKTARRSSLRLDCRHGAELRTLLENALLTLKRRDEEQVLPPRLFGHLLTILRGYATFAYYKSLPHGEFEQRFRSFVRYQGNHTWTHKKLYRLLGLHVIGHIERNEDFLRDYDAAINRAARKYPSVPRRWIEEIIWIESRGDPKTISRAGAYGLMQLMPLVYMGMGEEKAQRYPLAFGRTVNPFNPATNIERGAAFLDKLRKMMWPKIRRYGRIRRKRMIFHAYNAGVSRVLRLLKKHGRHYEGYLPGETKLYMKRLADFPRRY